MGGLDHLTGTSTTWDTSANPIASIKYMPWGATRSATGSLDTEIKFTGQRLDGGIELYYYGARYYDANIGRFISADSIVGNLRDPQTLNRYSYALNNPLRYIDPTGHDAEVPQWDLVKDDKGNIGWVSGGNIPAGAAAVQPWDVPQGTYGFYSSGKGSSGSGSSESRGNGPVTVNPSNPGALIANGASAMPALPGGPAVGVGIASTTTATSPQFPMSDTSKASIDWGNTGLGISLMIDGTWMMTAGFAYFVSGAVTMFRTAGQTGWQQTWTGITSMGTGFGVFKEGMRRTREGMNE